MTTRPAGSAEKAVSELYQAYMTGLILTLVTRRSTDDAARWIEALFRRQHEEKFLAGLDKLGLKDKPDAIACAGYHYLANKIGGVDVEFMAESDKKAWVRFVPPRWIYSGAAICGVPSEVSRGILRGWYGRNGITLGNPRLGFVCTAQTMDGQHGLAGYFLEYDRDLNDDERLVFRPGESPPPFESAAAPEWSETDWPAERLIKARRNYAIDYVRSGLSALVEMVEAVWANDLQLGRAVHQRLLEVNQSVFYDTNPVAIKYMMKKLGLMPSNEHRLPMLPATTELERRLDGVLERAGMLGAEQAA